MNRRDRVRSLMRMTRRELPWRGLVLLVEVERNIDITIEVVTDVSGGQTKVTNFDFTGDIEEDICWLWVDERGKER
jgi:hypothetical protein